MDQIKIGKFIKERRKIKGLTQKQLADKLLLSEKTVSKWETGNGLPDVSLMLPLCEILEVNVNELLSGEKLTDDEFKSHADRNLMKVLNEKKESKKRTALTFSVIFIVLLSVIALCSAASFADMSDLPRALLIVAAMIILAVGITVACVLDSEAGVYKCPGCSETFVPSFKQYVLAMHFIRYRHLRCPKCGRKSWCRRYTAKDGNRE